METASREGSHDKWAVTTVATDGQMCVYMCVIVIYSVDFLWQKNHSFKASQTFLNL